MGYLRHAEHKHDVEEEFDERYPLIVWGHDRRGWPGGDW
jgi:hypothetical protein